MNRYGRVLIYGFGPYRQFQDNITAKVVKSLPARVGLQCVVFPVRFHRGQFLEALRRYNPDAVLGLGQSARQRIEIETRAVNRQRASKKAQARPIRQRGPRWLQTTLKIKLGRRRVKLSNDAGDYVCNFSMYVMLEQIRRAQASIEFGFMHIPHDADLGQARRLVRRVLRNLRAPKRRRR
jgi:pyroglutamyl-peptidase